MPYRLLDYGVVNCRLHMYVRRFHIHTSTVGSIPYVRTSTATSIPHTHINCWVDHVHRLPYRLFDYGIVDRRLHMYALQLLGRFHIHTSTVGSTPYVRTSTVGSTMYTDCRTDYLTASSTVDSTHQLLRRIHIHINCWVDSTYVSTVGSIPHTHINCYVDSTYTHQLLCRFHIRINCWVDCTYTHQLLRRFHIHTSTVGSISHPNCYIDYRSTAVPTARLRHRRQATVRWSSRLPYTDCVQLDRSKRCQHSATTSRP